MKHLTSIMSTSDLNMYFSRTYLFKSEGDKLLPFYVEAINEREAAGFLVSNRKGDSSYKTIPTPHLSVFLPENAYQLNPLLRRTVYVSSSPCKGYKRGLDMSNYKVDGLSAGVFNCSQLRSLVYLMANPIHRKMKREQFERKVVNRGSGRIGPQFYMKKGVLYYRGKEVASATEEGVLSFNGNRGFLETRLGGLLNESI